MKLQEYILSATRSSFAYKSEQEIKDIWNNSSQEIFKDVQNAPRFYSANGAQAYTWLQKEVFHIVFRGTDEFNDVLADIDIDRIKLESNIFVHSGFLRYFNEIKDDILSELKSCTNSFHTIQITGHSLGGAMATIAAPIFGRIFNSEETATENFKTVDKKKKRIICHTVGSPRVGNLNFVKWFHSQVDESMRIANDDDPITLFPISCLYTHISEGLCLSDKCMRVVHSDVKWYWRLFSFPFYKSSTQDHSCNIYIKRLLEQQKLITNLY